MTVVLKSEPFQTSSAYQKQNLGMKIEPIQPVSSSSTQTEDLTTIHNFSFKTDPKKKQFLFQGSSA
jgi:hypothetical protein